MKPNRCIQNLMFSLVPTAIVDRFVLLWDVTAVNVIVIIDMVILSIPSRFVLEFPYHTRGW